MFEALRSRGESIAQQQAAARRERLAERLEALAPSDVQVGAEGERVVLSGRGLARRLALEPVLRWLVAEARDER